MGSNDVQEQLRTKWVDVAKFMAVIAVMIDHTYKLLYTNPRIAYFSYYSVSLFIFMMGMTTLWSYKKNNDSMLRKVWKKCLGIIRPYIVATIIYEIFIYRKFDFAVVLEHIIRFDMSGPFYYVLLYIQLVLISPMLFYIFEYSMDVKKGLLIEIVGFAVVLCISSWTTNCSNILGVYGGGGKLFGGTYLILLYLGMWFGKYYNEIHFSIVITAIFLIFASGTAIAWWQFIANNALRIDALVPYGAGFNPPSISFGLYALLVASTLYLAEMLLLHFPDGIPMKIMNSIAIMGKHTLYIFLYHRLFIDVIFPNLFSVLGIVIDNVWLKRIIYFVGMIYGSLLFECVLEKMHKKILVAYKIS